MLIRPAVAADIPIMMELEKHAVTAGHWSRERYDAFLAKETAGTAAGLRRHSAALVVEEGGAVVGFLVARGIESEWEIENVVVAGPARRRGLGARLMGEFIELARGHGAKAVFLEVRESNRGARMLYEKWAFVESGRRRSYYRDPVEDAILYCFEFA